MIVTALTLSNNPKQVHVDPQNPNRVVVKPNMTLVLLVFLIEFALFVWALTLAFKCGKSKNDLFLHVVFAFFFPVLYILYYYISGCGRQ
jgi:hypothetical protein